MKYETPEMTALTPAIKAVQGIDTKVGTSEVDGGSDREFQTAYVDWE
jgi:hypothetical protein